MSEAVEDAAIHKPERRPYGYSVGTGNQLQSGVSIFDAVLGTVFHSLAAVFLRT